MVYICYNMDIYLQYVYTYSQHKTFENQQRLTIAISSLKPYLTVAIAGTRSRKNVYSFPRSSVKEAVNPEYLHIAIICSLPAK